ncbi:MAG: hypothetical protein RMY16_31585 [Nostoc sp. DedQUE12b]|uniref:hypothetical protein n=1 Tax=Nostoc sp. DedQUE12b TaxID=3075398 RepID=UPI002AD54B0E|nr:hypothetical protein [Nostoc sp. DedQUE12b]MDZ8090063.1 hypothetical protein [Nostoc sp. DedQUE12b]
MANDLQADDILFIDEASISPTCSNRKLQGTLGGWTQMRQLRYITKKVDGSFFSGVYPGIAEIVTPWQIVDLEFLQPSHPVYTSRPRRPLEITFGFYAPRSSFCYPVGEQVL